MWMDNGLIVGRIVRIFGPSGSGQQRQDGQANDRSAQAIRPNVKPQQAKGPDRRAPIAFLLMPMNAATPMPAGHPTAPETRAPSPDHQVVAGWDHSRWPLLAAFVAR